MNRDQPPVKEPASTSDVWEQLEDEARARVIEMFADLAYRCTVARHDEFTKEEQHDESAREEKDVPLNRDAKE
jgi:hypothetical protein